MKSNRPSKSYIKLLVVFVSFFFLLEMQLSFSQTALAASIDSVNQLVSSKSCYQCDLAEIQLTEFDLESAYLVGSDLSNSQLSGSSLKSANLTGVVLDDAQLKNVDLSNTNLANASFVNANLDRAILSNADLTNANLVGANLKDVRLWGFAGFANLTSAKLDGADFSGEILNKVTFTDASLRNSDFADASLKGCDLRASDFEGADLSNVSLQGANLTNASLKGTNLANANLKRADLTNADLTDANLQGIQLDNAILAGTLGLDQYGEDLIAEAAAIAQQEDYPKAISFLQKVPSQTSSYLQAKAKIDKYLNQERLKEQRERDLDADRQLERAMSVADSGNYRRAISILSRIPKDTSSYELSQKKIASYERRIEENKVRREQIAQRDNSFDRQQQRSTQKDFSSSQANTESVRQENSNLVVQLADSRISEDTYRSVILSDLCPALWKREVNLSGIRNVLVVNRFEAQGYVFENVNSSCRELSTVPKDERDIDVLFYTHMYSRFSD